MTKREYVFSVGYKGQVLSYDVLKTIFFWIASRKCGGTLKIQTYVNSAKVTVYYSAYSCFNENKNVPCKFSS